MPTETASVPTIFVVFGATGDLMEKKLIPALFRLHIQGRLPKLFEVLAISRREMDSQAFSDYVAGVIQKTPEMSSHESELSAFTQFFHYMSGDFNDTQLYVSLSEKLGSEDKKWKACSNKIYYLAVPPINYQTIITNLSEKGLNTPCSDGIGYTRIILEKPFGHDRESARALLQLLSQHFSENQIYRLDHYLGKRMLGNLMAFRFSNTFFDGAWSNKYIERVEIKLLETIDAHERGAFYDSLGALRDVGQNHLLEFLAAVSMDNPGMLTADAVRNSRASILERLIVPDSEEILKSVVRGQYEGYRETSGVAPASMKETYFKLVAYLDHPLWKGVPFVLEAGKSLKETKKEVVITFKKSVTSLSLKAPDMDARNKMLFKLEPTESIQLDLLAKHDGYEMTVEDKRFLLNERDANTRMQYTEEYEKLLLDAFSGDQTFFVSPEEVDAQWRFTDPIISAFDNDSVRLTPYSAHSDEIRDHAKEYLREVIKTDKPTNDIGIVGLGKMGSNLARHFIHEGYRVVGFNRSREDTDLLSHEGLTPAYNLEELVNSLPAPRVVWLMLPHGEPTTNCISELHNLLSAGDTVIDGGNSHFEDAKKHAELLRGKGVEFVDVGVSGGPHGALTGACLMVGGNAKLYEHLYPLFKDISVPGGVEHFEGVGAGHFVKMVHNGIEYGMMQALAEGFTLLGKSPFVIDLEKAASVYSRGSVIESRLVSWLHHAFAEHGKELSLVKGSVDSLGEGDWALEFAQKMGVTDWVLKAAVDFRKQSQNNPDFTGQLLSAIRGQFGGHNVRE